jgi:hypothetical protein
VKHFSQIVIAPAVLGRTPQHMGVNVEIQRHAETTNLWDWLAHSGSTVAREFHPDRPLRRRRAREEEFAHVRTRAEFDQWRQEILADPAGGPVRWDEYLFEDDVPWIGVPDAIATRLAEIEVQPLYALGYGTFDYPRPLIAADPYPETVTDAEIDWAAAASAYEYYFAVIYHFASRFEGRRFMMMNEPENQWGWFHWPSDIRERIGTDGWRNGWVRLNWEDPGLGRAYLRALAIQYEQLARIARWTIDDVAGLLPEQNAERPFRLSGPTNVQWSPLWGRAGKYLDVLDLHHYHPEAGTFESIYHAASDAVADSGKPLAISEFGRLSGGISPREMLFGVEPSLEVADVLMTVLSMATPKTAPLEFLTFYLLHFPSTHRNYKHLLYGDMNVVDWSGRDTPLWNRGEEWVPSADELQIRHATPAFYFFRMLARLAGAGEVLASGLHNPTSSGPADIHDRLRTLAVRDGDRLIVTILNPGGPAENVRIAPGRAGRFAAAYVRETSRGHRDDLTGRHELADGPVAIDLAPRSLTQVIFTPDAPDDVGRIELSECTATLGTVDGLDLWQTTRLRALTPDGRDLTDLGVTWESDRPEVVGVDGGGLVQRKRNTAEAVRVTARSLKGDVTASVEIPPSH